MASSDGSDIDQVEDAEQTNQICDEQSEEEDHQSESDMTSQPRVPLHRDPDLEDPNHSKYKYGIIYLSYVPEGLTVKILREIMGKFGVVGRIYLEPEGNGKKLRAYSEGWIEFKKKRVAKFVAKSLNGTPLQYGRKHCKMNGQIWSIKYLHRFKWAHLTEQLAQDKATKDQKRRFEMSQVKRQVDFYQKMTEKSKYLRRLKQKKNGLCVSQEDSGKMKHNIGKRQNRPIDKGNEFSVPVDDDLLSSIFKKVS